MGERVVFQGVAGAFSELAALSFFGRGKSPEGLPEFNDVFRAVHTGRAAYAVLPIENSLTGSIHQNFDLFLEYPLWICGEIKLRIRHALIAHPGVSLGKLRKVYSHPQGLWQCQGFLGRHPHLERIAYFDTAGSARYIAESGDKEAAAIAAAEAAPRYGLVALKKGIEDNKKNFTRFLVLQKKEKKPVGRDCKTSVLFSLRNRPGMLHQALAAFSEPHVQIFKIESRPVPGKPWEYLFYLDFDGTPYRGAGKDALGKLAEVTDSLRVLGSYPQGKTIQTS